MPTVDLEMGRIHYEEAGPRDGRPVVFVHGFLMAGNLWRDVAGRVAARGARAIAPTWPLGSQPEPLKPGADTSTLGQVRIIAAFLDALGLDDVVLVGSDSGGALAQLVAVHHPARVGALVLTNCDTLEHFPPGFFKALVKTAKVPGGLRAALLPMKTAAGRRSPIGYGLMSHGDVDHLAREWVLPPFADERIMEELRAFTISLDSALTIDAARRLPGFAGPILLAWGADDTLFTPDQARRFAAQVPAARLELIPGARVFVMVDQPARLAELIAEVALSPAPAAA